MTKLHRFCAVVLCVATLASAATHYEYKSVDVDYNFDEKEESPRSAIMMIPDGTGPNVFTMARTVLDPSLKMRLHIDPHNMRMDSAHHIMMGTIQTHSSTMASNYQDLLDYQTIHANTGDFRLFGQFKDSHMTYKVDRLRELAANDTASREPSLPEMVDIVLSLLRKHEQAKKHGYFLMIVLVWTMQVTPTTPAQWRTKRSLLDHIEQTHNTAILSAADHGAGGLTLGRSGMEYPYPWYPTQLQQQNMSTEAMQERLDEILAMRYWGNKTCKTLLLEIAKTMLTSYTNVTSVTDEAVAKLVTEITTAVDKTRDLYLVLIELDHIISKPAWIDWTTVGHVGTDVNLYCKGPLIFERMCKCVLKNVYLNKLMTMFLGLEHQQELETMKHRNVSVLENPLVAELPPAKTW
ncbi:LOW QUALITY PROTEIN: Alkaline phosphatase [Phytophthora megakarya]|uniref:alkaline phosphatase n=1 Tax=Phytophthora megakarya TaxID=4795 RepID=A0A225VPE6_9STRA|nr:LOW QUALITY PROTEIN: Alkaline phosphatase [Phytophthora megakarya]